MTIGRGDIILFKQPVTWQDKLICRVTHGPYYHVAIALDSTHIIEALGSGIRVDAAPINDATFDTIDMTQYESVLLTETALIWAQAQTGKQYGWLDIVYQAIKFLAPNNPLRFGIEGHFDCSDFVTRYIQKTGYPLPDTFDIPYANSPNDIARIFQVLPLRKAVLV